MVCNQTLKIEDYISMIYLDNSATTKPCEAAIKAVSDNMRHSFGNASSLHKMGIEAEKTLKSAKKTLLSLLAADGEIYFTSGATESSNTALFGVPAAYRHNGKKIITTSFEHPSVENPLRKLEESGYTVVRVSPPKSSDDNFEKRVIDEVDENTLLVSVMWVNNETGFVTDISRIYEGVKRKNPKTIVHSDAVQGFCKLPVRTLRADLISLSAHKIHGPKGIGALYCAKGTRFSPLLYGGGQQGNLRSGTEPIDLIAGFEAAAKSYPDCAESFSLLYNALTDMLTEIDGVHINSFNNVKNIMNFSVRGVRSEIMLHFLEEREIYVSSGSACSKGKKSHVLGEFGVSDADADSAIRVSFSPETTENDLNALVEGIKDGIKRFRR